MTKSQLSSAQLDAALRRAIIATQGYQEANPPMLRDTYPLAQTVVYMEPFDYTTSAPVEKIWRQAFTIDEATAQVTLSPEREEVRKIIRDTNIRIYRALLSAGTRSFSKYRYDKNHIFK